MTLCTISIAGAFACESDDPEGPTPSISVALSPSTLTVQQGQSGTATVTLSRSNYDDNVTLNVTGAPTGVTATLSPASLSGTTTTATLTVNAGTGAAAGPATLTVTASGSGVTTAEADLALTINAAPAGSYTLAVDPTSVTVTQGGSVEATVNLTREGGFAGEVSLAATGLPEGVTAAFDPAATTGGSSTLTLTAAGDAAAGSATITITGTADGQTDQTAALALTVQEASTGGNVTWTFCPASGVPVWVAYQDGDGDWVRASQGSEPNSWVMQFDEDRGGIAYVTDFLGTPSVNVWYGLRTELGEQGGELCDEPGETFSVTGSVTGVDATDQVFISLGTASAVVIPALGSEFTLENVAPGTHDLIASRVTIDDSGDDPVMRTEELILRRDVQTTAGQELAVLDFASDEAFAPVEHEVTIEGANGDQTFLIAGYFTDNGVASGFFTGLPTLGDTKTYAGIPADRQQPGDIHLLSVVAMDDPANPTRSRTVQEFFVAAGDRTVTLGPVLDNGTVSAIPGAPYPRLQAVQTRQPEYTKYFFADFSQLAREWQILASAAWVGAGSDVTLAVPDFSGVEGWDPGAWALEAGEETEWTVGGFDWSVAGGIFAAPFTDGGRVVSANRHGTITP